MLSGKLLLQVAKTKSGKLADHGSQLLTNALHDYHPAKIVKNRGRLVVVEMGRRAVVEQGCKKVSENIKKKVLK